jgi:hypothetical protein
MSAPPLRVHRFIEKLASSPESRAQFLADPGPLFDQFALEHAQRAALREGTVEALRKIGVHPSMVFKFLIATGRAPIKFGSARYYLDRV